MLNSFFSILVLVLTLTGPGVPDADAAQWKILKTRYLNLHFQNLSDLEKFDSNITPVKHSARFSNFTPDESEKGEHGRLANKVDQLVEKVQLILDMRKPIRINIRIYPGKKALQDTYFRIFKKRRNMRAWYIFERNTIYVNVEDLFSGMLAHEIAHGIIDHFLVARPPRATAEILARYVDAHLNEEAKTY